MKGSPITSFSIMTQQKVSDNAHFMKGSPITSFPTYDQQPVSDIAHFVNCSVIRSFLMMNSMWVTLHILWKVVSWCSFLWLTVCEWHCTLCERQSHFCDQQLVSDVAHFVEGQSHHMTNREWVTSSHLLKDSLIIPFPMTNSLWVTLHILWMVIHSLTNCSLWVTLH